MRFKEWLINETEWNFRKVPTFVPQIAPKLNSVLPSQYHGIANSIGGIGNTIASNIGQASSGLWANLAAKRGLGAGPNIEPSGGHSYEDDSESVNFQVVIPRAEYNQMWIQCGKNRQRLNQMVAEKARSDDNVVQSLQHLDNPTVIAVKDLTSADNENATLRITFESGNENLPQQH